MCVAGTRAQPCATDSATGGRSAWFPMFTDTGAPEHQNRLVPQDKETTHTRYCYFAGAGTIIAAIVVGVAGVF